MRRDEKPRARPQSPDDGNRERFRLLPNSDIAEEGLINTAMLKPEILDEIQVSAEAFHNPARRMLWEQLLAMRDARMPVDVVTLTKWLADRQLLESVGGAYYISQIFILKHAPGYYQEYVKGVHEKHLLRSMILLGRRLEERCYDEQDNVPAVLEETVTAFVELAAGRQEDDTIVPISRFAIQAVNEIEYAYKNRGGTVGLPTGFVDLDRMTGGLKKGETIYVGARPAMGKTSLGLNFAAHVAAAGAEVGAPTLFYSIEMTGVQLAKRLILTKAKLNQQRCRDGFFGQKDLEDLGRATAVVGGMRLDVDETAALTIAHVRARTRRWIKRIRRQQGERKDGKPDGLVIIDYLQRMKGSSKRAEDARYLELQEIAQGISQTAKDLQIPIIILAQLKRPKDKKPDTEPDMTEFRECGDVEQEAHIVALLHRPHYYVKHSPEKQQALAEDYQERFRAQAAYKGSPNAGSLRFTEDDLKCYAKLIIDKQREGPVGPIDLRFTADYTLFENWDDRPLFSNNKAERQLTPDQQEAAEELPVAEQTEFLEEPES